jgi:hypothetical protein
MKNILVLLFIIATHQTFGQSPQVFAKDKFKISCPCKLYINEVFMEMVKEQGMEYPVTSYVCTENDESYDLGVINHINIYDLASEYKGIPVAQHNYFESKYLETYEEGLSQADITYKHITFKGVRAVEYEFSQNGLPTKAIMFIKNQKSYLLQVATRKSLALKFHSFKSSFTII